MRSFERLDQISRWLLVAVAGLLPFFFVPVAWMDSTQSKMFIVAGVLTIAAALWLVARFMEGAVRIPWTLVLGLAAFLPIVYALSSAVSGMAPISLVATAVEPDTLTFVCVEFGLLTLFALVFCMHGRRTAEVLAAFLIGGSIAIVLEVIHFIFPSISLGGVLSGQAGNAFGGWHEFSILLGLFVLLVIALRDSSFGQSSLRHVFHAAALLAFVLLIIAGYFDVWAILFAALAALVLVRGFRVQGLSTQSFWRSQWLPLTGVVAALFFMTFGPFIINVLPARLYVAQTDVRPSLQGTLAVGQQALSHPVALLFGSGPNTFTRDWGLYKPVGVNQTPYWNTDFSTGSASIPTSFVTVGIVGVLAWIFFVLALLWLAVSVWMSRTGPATEGDAVALSLASVYLVAFQIFSAPGAGPSLLAFIFIGLLIARVTPGLIAPRHLSLRGSGWVGRGYLAGAFVFTMICVVAGVSVVRVGIAEAMVNRAIVVYNSSKDIARSSSIITQALAIYSSDNRAHLVAVQLGLLELQQLASSANSDQAAARTQLQQTLQQTIQSGLAAVSIDSNDYQNWLELASLYANLAGSNVQGAYDNARAAYSRAQAENPTSPLPLLALAQLEILQKNTDAALSDLAQAVQLKPDLPDAYYLASQIYAGQNDFKDALLAANSAAQYAPSDPQAWYNLGSIAYGSADYTDAAVALQQSLTLEPQFANAMYVLGLSYYQLKRPDDALAEFAALDKLDPNQPTIQNIIANLQAGKSPVPSVATSTPQKAPAKK